MKIGLIVTAIVTSLFVVVFLKSPVKSNEVTIEPGFSDSSVVVVELFTSEGCSSCPSADRLASQIQLSFGKNNYPVYVLAFHVDYWDYIGWKDRFAKPEFTDRQRLYGEKFNLESIYTPQMIVNGQNEFVGSNSAKAQEAILESLRHEAAVRINLKSQWAAKNELKISYRLSASVTNSNIHIALVESGLSNQVSRGENSGRKLNHDNVVRVFITSEAKENSELTLTIPPEVHLNQSSVIVFVQDKTSWKILGAGRVQLSSIPN